MFFNKFNLVDTHNHWIIANENETLLDNKDHFLWNALPFTCRCFSEVCTSSPMYTVPFCKVSSILKHEGAVKC